MFDWFYNRTTKLQVVNFPQDPSGGTIPAPATVAVLVPCCVQQDTPPEKDGQGQYRQGTKSRLRIFFGTDSSGSPDLAYQAVGQLTVESRVVLDDGRTVVLLGPAYDEAGRGAYYVAECQWVT